MHGPSTCPAHLSGNAGLQSCSGSAGFMSRACANAVSHELKTLPRVHHWPRQQQLCQTSQPEASDFCMSAYQISHILSGLSRQAGNILTSSSLLQALSQSIKRCSPRHALRSPIIMIPARLSHAQVPSRPLSTPLQSTVRQCLACRAVAAPPASQLAQAADGPAELLVRSATTKDVRHIVSLTRELAEETENLYLPPDQVTAGVSTLITDASKGRAFVIEVPVQPVSLLVDHSATAISGRLRSWRFAAGERRGRSSDAGHLRVERLVGYSVPALTVRPVSLLLHKISSIPVSFKQLQPCAVMQAFMISKVVELICFLNHIASFSH